MQGRPTANTPAKIFLSNMKSKKKRRTLADRSHDEKAMNIWAASLRNDGVKQGHAYHDQDFDATSPSAAAELPPSNYPAHAVVGNDPASASDSKTSPSYMRLRNQYSPTTSRFYRPMLASPIFASPEMQKRRSPENSPMSPEEKYQAVVHREIQRIEAQDRLVRWKRLQTVKKKNDEKIGGMIANVHDLMEQYGLRPKSIAHSPPSNSTTKNSSYSNSNSNSNISRITTTRTTTTTNRNSGSDATSIATAELAHRNSLIKGIFDAAPPRVGNTRSLTAIQTVLKAGSQHGQAKGGRSAEAYMCEFLLNADFKLDNSMNELTLDEFVSKVEETLDKAIKLEEENESDGNKNGKEEKILITSPPPAPSEAEVSLKDSSGGRQGRRRRSLLTSDTDDKQLNLLPPPILSGLVREGWMYKLGQKNKTWKRRWFQLVAYTQRGCSLIYFTEPNGLRKGGIHMIGAVAIDEIIDHVDVAEQRCVCCCCSCQRCCCNICTSEYTICIISN
jgi:hypothetical protein